eukprot:TRINITY_DN6622_c0_g1_i1.p1 TRINITY_DN6622_c0_g1~~TRINITY_DN6622_c0_g1_i1.p1  ORF type:complete len:944 (+),score=157.14 TRINITY_DN6622_c0_g1_i1:62-2893(+)
MKCSAKRQKSSDLLRCAALSSLIACLFISIRSSEEVPTLQYRYYSDQSSDGKFFTGRDITLEYIPGSEANIVTESDVSWFVPSVCVDGASEDQQFFQVDSFKTIIKCMEPSVYDIRLRISKLNAEESFKIDVALPNSCFEWYIATVSKDSKLSPMIANQYSTIRLWAFDPIDSNSAELLGDAVSPSPQAAAISRKFFSLGQNPIVKVTDASHVGDAIAFPDFTFDKNSSFWFVNISSPVANVIRLEIDAKSLAFLGCQLKKSTKFLPIQPSAKYPPVLTDADPVIVTQSDVVNGIQYDSCASNIATILLTNSPCGDHGELLMMTEDHFQSISYRCILSGKDVKAVSSIPRKDGSLVILLNNGSVIQQKDSQSQPFLNIDSKVNTLRKMDSCDSSNSATSVSRRFYNSVVFAWKKDTQTDHVFYILPNSLEATKVYLNESLQVMDVVAHFSVPYFSFLVQTKEKSVELRRYNYETNQVENAKQAFKFSTEDSLKVTKMRSSASTSVETFVYGSSVFYSPDGGYSAFELKFRPMDVSSNFDAQNLVIVDIATSKVGEFVAQTSTNRLFFGSSSTRTLQEIKSGFPESSWMLLFWRIDGNLLAIDPTSKTQSYVIPYRSELQINALAAENEDVALCPYDEWTDSVDSLVKVLDYRDSYELSVSLASDDQSEVGISYLTSDAVVNEVMTDQQVRIVGVGLEVTRDLTIRNKIKIDPKSNYPSLAHAESLSELRIYPTFGSLSCPVHQKVVQIQNGCPSGRTIKVRELSYNPDDCPLWVNQRVDDYIPDESRNRPAHDNSESSGGLFNISTYGCPLTRRQGSSVFQVELDLYDGENLVETMTAEYVAYEIHGRNDYTYKLSEKDAGCLVAQEGWAERLEVRIHSFWLFSYLRRDHHASLSQLLDCFVCIYDYFFRCCICICPLLFTSCWEHVDDRRYSLIVTGADGIT